jgi:hypothetical protein
LKRSPSQWGCGLAAADRRPLATYIELVLKEHVERSGKTVGKRK